MSLNRMFDMLESTRDAAQWKAAFGEPQQIEGKTIIPVAQVGFGYGLGFGRGAKQTPAEEEAEPARSGEGGGGGGGATSKPLGAIVVTAEKVYFEPVHDAARITMAGMAVGALFLWQAGVTLRALFSRK